MKKTAFIIVICVQLGIIIYLSFQIKKKTSSTLGASVTVVDSKKIKTVPSLELKHFYEPIANSTEEVHMDWLTYTPKYTINDDSLNERFNYDIQKENDVFRIITLGDSFTFGSYVDTKDNWTELLEDDLNKKLICPKIKKFEVINLGVGAYDTAYEVERYKMRGMKYNPDLLIMLVIDFMRMTEYRSEHRKTFTKEETMSLQAKGIFHPGEEEDQNVPDDKRIFYQYPQYDKLFHLYSGNVLVVDHEKNQKAREFFSTLRNKYPKLRYTKTTLPFIDKNTSLPDGHPSKDGHRAIAEDIFKYLLQNKPTICSQ